MSNSTEYIRENIEEIREKVAAAAGRAGRDPAEITILAVGKTFGGELLREAYTSGIRHFGENYIQEAVDKIKGLDLNVTWHFIGHLQKNKVRTAVKHFSVIQSVDSLKLLQRIDRIAGEEGKKLRVLLEVDLAGEETKFGMPREEVFPLLEEAAGMENVSISGLMLLPPFYDDPERNRVNFKNLRELSQEIDRRGYINWNNRYLSMGMTDDYEIAIEEGSNMVRIGRAMFGPRRR